MIYLIAAPLGDIFKSTRNIEEPLFNDQVKMESRLGDIKILPLQSLDDERGGMTKFFDYRQLEDMDIQFCPKQMLRSHTTRAVTMRGIHAQIQPYSEAKLLSGVRGRMFWVAVDLRHASPTFGQWQAIDLRPENKTAVYIPAGFGHSCLSLQDNTTVNILADNVYHETAGIGIRWDDPDLAIEWPETSGPLVISDAHANYGSFKDFIHDHKGL